MMQAFAVLLVKDGSVCILSFFFFFRLTKTCYSLKGFHAIRPVRHNTPPLVLSEASFTTAQIFRKLGRNLTF